MPAIPSKTSLSPLAIQAGLALHRARVGRPYKLTARDKAEQLHAAVLPTVLIGMLTTAVATWIAWTTDNATRLSIWAGVSMILFLAHWVDGRTSRRQARSPRPAARPDWPFVVKRHLTLLALSGASWVAYSLMFLGNLDVIGRVSVLSMLTCMATGMMVSVSIIPYFSNALTVLLIGPASVMILMGQRDDAHMGLVSLGFMAAIIAWSHINERRIAVAIGMTRLNDKLVVDTIRQQKTVESLNRELRQAQDSLLELNQQLEERVRQRTSLLRREITEREGYQKRLESLASSDPLTGLANRARLASSIALELDAALEGKTRVAVYFIDLDRFKEVNDVMGHYTGDRVLEAVSARLSVLAVDAGCVARWGGDEFVVVQAVGESTDDDLESFATSIVTSVSEPIWVGNSKAIIGASVGIAVFPEHGNDPESLIRHADLAVYQAKLAGRSCIRMFRPDWQHRARERIQMIQALKDAIESDSLTLNYQPILDPVTGNVASMEALLRWRHADFGVVSPAVFVALAEESGLMVALGNWVLRRACHDARHLVGPYCDRVAVNASAHQFTQGDFKGVLEEAMQDSGLDPRSLELELTETVYAHDANQVRETLQAIRRLGVKIAIDDFGTGYSSLAYLQRFPVDVLKVDRSFVRDIDSGGDTIIAAVTSLARSLGVQVVVEGIETIEQLVHVRNLGADQVQGFLFAKPMELQAAIDWLHNNESRALRVPEPVLEMPAIR